MKRILTLVLALSYVTALAEIRGSSPPVTASSLTGTLAIANGGTGQTTAPNAINALLPTQTSHSGEFLTTNGTVASWAAVSGGANTTLSNLGTTSINASLLPQNIGLSLGGASNRWADFFTEQLRFYSGVNGYGIVSTDGTTPAGANAGISYRATDPAKTLAFFTATDGTANATATSAVFVETGNKTAGTGRSGAVVLQTGTSSGGKRGEITANSGLLNVSSAIAVTKVTADPCADTVLFPESAIFYNNTSDYFCFCNGAGADVQFHSPATACF